MLLNSIRQPCHCSDAILQYFKIFNSLERVTKLRCFTAHVTQTGFTACRKWDLVTVADVVTSASRYRTSENWRLLTTYPQFSESMSSGACSWWHVNYCGTGPWYLVVGSPWDWVLGLICSRIHDIGAARPYHAAPYRPYDVRVFHIIILQNVCD